MTLAAQDALASFLRLDLAPLVALSAASVSLAVLGSFLVLRRQAMLGDALSHAVLPGLVVAWMVTGSRAPVPMLVGALAAGAATSLLVGVIDRYGRVERGAALGVVFTALFALGVLLIETTGAHRVDLDVDCVLSGQPELLVWPAPRRWVDLARPETWRSLPHQVPVLLGVLALTLLAVTALARPLRTATFDPRFAAAVGGRPGAFNALLLGLVTFAVVASFEAVGTILVVGLLVTPAATARLLTDRLRSLIALSAGLGLATALGGYALATRLAPALGLGALDAAGTIAALGGALLGATALVAPRRGGGRG